jgi:transcriptional regulator with XRE-family HTH domain
MASNDSRISNSPSTPKPNRTVKLSSSRNPSQQFGEFVGRLRNRRGLSRSQFAVRALEQLDEASPYFITESLLKRIELGQVVKLNRGLVDVLAQLLDCTFYERIRLLVLADLNPFAHSQDDMSEKDLALAYAFVQLKDWLIVWQEDKTGLHDPLSLKFADDQLLRALKDLVDHMNHAANG